MILQAIFVSSINQLQSASQNRRIYLCISFWFILFLDVSEDFDIDGKSIHLSMLHNPSHLEAVNPVSMGKTRSKQQTHCDGAFSSDSNKSFGSNVINVQVR